MKKLLFLFPFLILFLPIRSFADEKNMTIGLTSEYTQATFYLDFTEEKTYTVTVTSPSGLSHETVIESNTGSVSISDIENGTYSIKISADGSIDVKSRVECKKTEVTANTKEINVSKVVSGLKIYFSNTDLCIDWDKDSNDGDINVVITEPTTMQILDSTSVKGNFYTLDFDESIKQLEVYLVPAKSSKIEGAGSRFTIDVVLDNLGRVNFPEKTLYNVTSYSFNADVLDNMTVMVFENEKNVFEKTFQAGTQEIEIPLNDMKNYITVWLEDEKGNLNSFSTVIDRDIDAPQFKINSFDTVTKDSTLVISGSVSEATSVFFNDYEVTTDEYGRFAFSNNLVIGENPITIYAEDLAGNVTTVDYVITRKEVNYAPLLIVIIIGFGFLIFGVVYKKKKEFGNSEPKKPKTNNFQKPQKERKLKEPKEPKEQKERKYINPISEILGIVPIFVTGICVVLTFVFLIKGTFVASGSMEPTLMTDNVVLYNQLAYSNKPIQRGDIICFYSKEQGQIMSKRIIGIPGDIIEFRDGFTIINGMKAEESYLDENVETNCTKTFEVPENCVFVMGDNRENSYDSRYWENPYVNIKDIYGKFLGQIKKIW